MALSISDLPMDDGYLPAGKWMVVLRDNLNDGLGGCAFRHGITTAPVDGRLLKRLVTFMPVAGALRVEGAPLAIGDVSRLGVPSAPAPAPVPVAEPAAAVSMATVTAPATHAPTSRAELNALSEPSMRKLVAEMGEDEGSRTWAPKRMRRFIADELGIEGA